VNCFINVVKELSFYSIYETLTVIVGNVYLFYVLFAGLGLGLEGPCMGSGAIMCRDVLFWCYISCLFVCLLNFLPAFLFSLLSSFIMLSFLLIYFLTCLLPD